MRNWWNLPGGFHDEPAWDLRHSASASSEADSCWAKGSSLDNLPSGAQLVTCNKKELSNQDGEGLNAGAAGGSGGLKGLG